MEAQEQDAPSSIGADSPSAGMQGDDNAESYNSIAYNQDPQSVYNAMMEITDKNPFGANVPGFIQGLSSIFGPLDYTNILGGKEAIKDMADRQYGLAMNPQNQPGMVGYNPNVPTVTTGVREGLTRGFGSLFGSPVGISTVQGPVAAQREKDPMGSAMMGAFSALAPMSLPTIAAQAIGRDTYTTKGAPDYDPTIDPATSSYTGPSSLGGIVDALSLGTTGMTSTTAQEVYGVAKDAIQDAIDYFSNPKGGITSADFTGMMSTREKSDQFGVPDNRSFDAFGNVVGSPSKSSFADDIGQERAGIASLSPTDAADANIQVADASSMFSNAINFSKDITDKDKGYQFGPGKFNIDIDPRNRYAPEVQYNIPISDFLDRAFG